MGAQGDPIILGLTANPDSRSMGLAGQPDPLPFWSILGLAELNPTLLGPVE